MKTTIIIALMLALVATIALDCNRAQVLRAEIQSQKSTVKSLQRRADSNERLNYSEINLLGACSILEGIKAGIRAKEGTNYRPSYAMIWTNVVVKYNASDETRKISLDPDATDWPSTNLQMPGGL